MEPTDRNILPDTTASGSASGSSTPSAPLIETSATPSINGMSSAASLAAVVANAAMANAAATNLNTWPYAFPPIPPPQQHHQQSNVQSLFPTPPGLSQWPPLMPGMLPIPASIAAASLGANPALWFMNARAPPPFGLPQMPPHRPVIWPPNYGQLPPPPQLPPNPQPFVPQPITAAGAVSHSRPESSQSSIASNEHNAKQCDSTSNKPKNFPEPNEVSESELSQPTSSKEFDRHGNRRKVFASEPYERRVRDVSDPVRSSRRDDVRERERDQDVSSRDVPRDRYGRPMPGYGSRERTERRADYQYDRDRHDRYSSRNRDSRESLDRDRERDSDRRRERDRERERDRNRDMNLDRPERSREREHDPPKLDRHGRERERCPYNAAAGSGSGRTSRQRDRYGRDITVGRSRDLSRERPSPERDENSKASTIAAEADSSSAPTDAKDPLAEISTTGLEPIKKDLTLEEIYDLKPEWTRCSPADLYFKHATDPESGKSFMQATQRMIDLQNTFKHDLLERAARVRAAKPAPNIPPRRVKVKPSKIHHHHHHHHHGHDSDQESDSCKTDCNHSNKPHNQKCLSNHSDSDYSDPEESDEEEDSSFEELQRKRSHPWRLHDELWYNDPGEMNDGPLCRCSARARRTGIRHGIFPGEDHLPACNPGTNNAARPLHHYRIAVTPNTNFFSKYPTAIRHDGHDFIFEGFSLLSHTPLENIPACKIIRFNIEYNVTLEEEVLPPNFTVEALDMITEYIFKEILELVDIDWRAHDDPTGCPRYHLFPRFARLIEDNGKELLSLNSVLAYLLAESKPLVEESQLQKYMDLDPRDWEEWATKIKSMIVTYPGMKPASVRVDQIDKEVDATDLTYLTSSKDQPVPGPDDKSPPTVADQDLEVGEIEEKDQDEERSSSSSSGNVYNASQRLDLAKTPEPKPRLVDGFPVIVHFGVRPPQLSYAGNPKYQKAWREYVKFRHLLANKPKVTQLDRQMLALKEEKLQEMRLKSDLKRDVTVVMSTKGFHRTGIFCDVVQHALLVPVVISYLRFHQSLSFLESRLEYSFRDKYLLQLALTHPSYRENFGTNPDHARNILTNCGIRQPAYGDRRVHFMNTRKRGINMLINIMSRFGCNQETESNINHNERLEFLGDAVVEFMTSIHLYFMFPDLEEGGLATYRAALVQNQHLALLAKRLELDRFMLYAHGSDLCHDLELRHAMANCFEALMGSLFLDGGISVPDKIFGSTFFAEEPQLLRVWVNLHRHPLQRQYPASDRGLIERIPRLRELQTFEGMTGLKFTHIRLLARAFTHRSVGYNNLTLGSNQRMEFLGDTVLQLVASEYLYKHFPEHHEGHLSLLRSSLVNNKTQSVVCDDLGMTQFAQYNYAKGDLKVKDRADLLEAFLGALYVDQGLDPCRVFCEVCFFPRLEHFILNQDWNDPKSKLQQCCLTLRSVDGGEPDIPIYKVIECLGPTNTREYRVAVYFRDKRLAVGIGHSIQEAEMSAASNAIDNSRDLFPQLHHQKKVIERSLRQKTTDPKSSSSHQSHSSNSRAYSNSRGESRERDNRDDERRDRCYQGASSSRRRSASRQDDRRSRAEEYERGGGDGRRRETRDRYSRSPPPSHRPPSYSSRYQQSKRSRHTEDELASNTKKVLITEDQEDPPRKCPVVQD